MDMLWMFSGIVIGFLIGFFLCKSNSGVLTAKMEMIDAAHGKALEQEVKRREEQEQEAMRREDALRKEFEQQKLDLKEYYMHLVAAQKADSEKRQEELEKHHRREAESQQQRFDETLAKVTEQMKSATDEMLKQRQQEFSASSSENLGQIVNPLRETIERMKQVMNETTLKQTVMGSEMKVTIENMMRHSEAARQTADELARAFKHGTKVQGDWGETVLDELLQSQGLTKGIHYDTQTVIRDASGNSVRTEEGNTMRPDVILHLDQRRELIIDSKVSLTAFMDYVNAEDDVQRQKFLKAHVESVNKHVKELSAKDYSSYVQPPKVRMDYVIMFVPHTGAMWTALNAQPDLWRKALEKNVFIADEQTLFAALRIVNLTWTQIVQAQNHEKVFALANEMIDRVGQFYKRYDALGKALQNAQKAYEEGDRKLQSQGQSIIGSARKLIHLGARSSERNPLPPVCDAEDVDKTPALESE